jgi:aryl-alcohol dehydrogenase-like predicted oxidoreductase
MLRRVLGRSGIQVSAMGLGGWAVGGPFWKNGQPVGWGEVDDNESIQAIHRALELGITFFDTADVYGCGHSERVIGQALKGKRESVVIATKFGQVFVEETRQAIGYDTSPTHIRQACDASLRRLDIDTIDLYQLHVKDVSPEKVPEILEVLESLVSQGKIRFYGWSTDDPARARLFAVGSHCTSIQHRLNILESDAPALEICEEFNLASINRSPLAMGLLTGKYSQDSVIPANDVRSRRPVFQENRVENLQKLEKIRSLLTQDSRTLAQGALGWLWARSDKTIPIPGFKSVKQVEENVQAMQFGPLAEEQMKKIDEVLNA